MSGSRLSPSIPTVELHVISSFSDSSLSYAIQQAQKHLTAPTAYTDLIAVAICIHEHEQIRRYQIIALKKQEPIQQHIFQSETCFEIG